jgi:hypothetical protein
MPSLSSDNNVAITISTTADTSGITDATKGVDNFSAGFEDSMKNVAKVTGVAGAALTAFSVSSVDYLKNLVSSSKSLATQTGMTVEQSSQLIAVMGRLGISSDQASSSLRIFAKNIADSSTNAADNAAKVADMNNKIAGAKIEITQYTAEIQKNGDSSGALQNKIDALNISIKGYQTTLSSTQNTLDKLGVTTVDSTGKTRDFNSILLDVADKFKAMPDGAEKTADALSLFGRSGASMIKILDKGSQGISDLEAQASKLGLTLTSQNIGAINGYIESQKKLKDSTDSIKIAVGSLTAPVLANFNNAVNDVILKLIGTSSPARGFVADVLAFGGPVLGAISGFTAFVANLDQATEAISKFGIIAKAGAGLDAIQAGMSLITFSTIPEFIAEVGVAKAAWLAAFPVAGILADIALVYEAVKSVLGAYSAVNNAQTAANNAETSQEAAIREVNADFAAGKITKAQQVKILTNMGNVPQHALGTNNAPAGWSWVGEKGPELIKMRGGEQVKTAGQSAQMASGGASSSFTHIGDVYLSSGDAVKTYFSATNQDGLLASKGLTVKQGAA